MKRKLLSVLVLLVTVFSFGFGGAVPVSAEGVGVCTFIQPICNALGITGDDPGIAAQKFVQQRLNLVLSLVFVAIILIAVYVIVRAAVKYIQSQGQEDKIAEAQKAIKSVFMGIAMLFIGILGIVLVLFVFGASDLFGTPGGTDNQDCYFDENRILICPKLN